MANGEALTRDSVEKCLATGCTVESNVPNQNVFLCRERGSSRRIHDQSSTGKTFAYIIVGLAFESECDSLGQECTQALPGRSFEVNADGIVGKPSRPGAASDRTTQHGSDRAINIVHRQCHFNRRESFNCSL